MSLSTEAYSKNISISWDSAKLIKPVLLQTQPIITESIEIIKRKYSENLINDRVAWEPPQTWKYALNRDNLVIIEKDWRECKKWNDVPL